MLHIATSVAIIIVGLLLALVLSAPSDVRVFGWVAVAIGVLGLVSRVWIARQGNQRRR